MVNPPRVPGSGEGRGPFPALVQGVWFHADEEISGSLLCDSRIRERSPVLQMIGFDQEIRRPDKAGHPGLCLRMTDETGAPLLDKSALSGHYYLISLCSIVDFIKSLETDGYEL